MITKINLMGVASYKKPTALETDKKVNLIYGLNGTGKSTLSNLLYKSDDPKFANCSIEGLNDDKEVLVYNQNFIRDTFFEPESLNGIFTLSKQNKEAETKIENALKEIKRIEDKKLGKENELKEENTALSQKVEEAKNSVWAIKKDYTGGDRVLEFCLDGLKSDGNKLLSFVENLPKPAAQPTKSIDTLKGEIQSISGDNEKQYEALSPIIFSSSPIEENTIFKKVIVGNENSAVFGLIHKLGNSDWVKDGLKYLPISIKNQIVNCPFCQEKTISNVLIASIRDYFDESYEGDIKVLKEFLGSYSESINSIPPITVFEDNPKFESHKKDFEIKYNLFFKIIDRNKSLIEDKIRTPSIPVTLDSSLTALKELNDVIQKINTITSEHNYLVLHKDASLAKIKTTFWDIMRWDYDQSISVLNSQRTESEKNANALRNLIRSFDEEIDVHRRTIIEEQLKTVNIEEAIMHINSGLIDIGIEDFKIKHHTDNLYKIVRGDSEERIFRSLSEGEKMIISFLYFLELCRGKRNSADPAKKKIVVIDDPISSLSHIYVFNVGRLIKNEFFGKKETKDGVTTWKYKYEQVFILTHSLYFFYEITETKHEERKETQKLFRLNKNNEGSIFYKMSYEEIQNDYQAYWFVIKDEKQPPALIANCMRNVIEYFFNFVEKKNLNNFFLQPGLQQTRFQAFNRYINRESHSLGQNIFDFKEFDYSDFKEAFAMLFKEAGYEAHYKKMIK